MQSVLDQLKIKPKPKKLDVITVKLNPQKKEDVEVNVSIIDKRKEQTLNRNEILKTIKQKTEKKEEEMITKSNKETIESNKKKSKKLGKISLQDDSVPKSKTSVKRVTTAPEKNVILEVPREDVVIGNYIDKEQLPKKKEKVLITSSSYYMNNRQKFTSFITFS